MRIVDKMSPFSVEEGDTIFLEIGELEVVVDPTDEGYNILVTDMYLEQLTMFIKNDELVPVVVGYDEMEIDDKDTAFVLMWFSCVSFCCLFLKYNFCILFLWLFLLCPLFLFG